MTGNSGKPRPGVAGPAGPACRTTRWARRSAPAGGPRLPRVAQPARPDWCAPRPAPRRSGRCRTASAPRMRAAPPGRTLAAVRRPAGVRPNIHAGLSRRLCRRFRQRRGCRLTDWRRHVWPPPPPPGMPPGSLEACRVRLGSGGGYADVQTRLGLQRPGLERPGLTGSR